MTATRGSDRIGFVTNNSNLYQAMIREEIHVDGVRPMSKLAVYLLIGITTLAIGVGLLTLRHYTLSATEAALTWVPTPAVVERAEFARVDDGSRVLDLEYRYEFRGITYRSDRLDLLPGRTGDDDAWEEQLLARWPVGSEVTCYVDPANPRMAVLDRQRGAAGAGTLRLLAFPFLAIAAAFLFAAAKNAWPSVSRVLAGGGLASGQSSSELAGPPRRIGPVTAGAILFHAPGQVQLAWAFFVGFAIVFTTLEGPAVLRELWPSDEARVEGEVTRVKGLEQWEFTRQVFEYEFRYPWDGKTRTGTSHTVGQRYEVGDLVEIVLNSQLPDSARIADTRRRFAPWWVVAIPFGVMLLLSVGIVGSYVFNLRWLILARNGLVATATRREPGDPAGSAEAASSRAAMSKYEFQVGGETVFVDPRSMVGGEAKTIHVLYDPRKPARNVGIGDRTCSILSGTVNPWPRCLVGMLVPAACVSALVWLWFGG